MKAGRAAQKLQFEAYGKRDVVADFDGGRMTSDGGGLLLREANCCLGDLMARLGQCVSDFRQQGSVEHTEMDLIAQCGDLEALRAGPSGDGRPASLPPGAGGPDLFLESQAEAPEEIWLDLDAIDDPTHGQQASRKAVSIMATTGSTAICRCTFSASTTRCARGCGRWTGTPPTAAWRSWSASWDGSGSAGRRPGSASARTRGSAATGS